MVLLASLPACGGSSAASQKAALDVADVFLIALRGALWETAFHRLDPAMREECGGSAHELGRRAIASLEARLTDWHLSVSSAYETNVILDGEVEREGREPVSVGIVAEDDGEQWRITVFEVDGLALCRLPAAAGNEAAETNTEPSRRNEP